MCLEEAVTEKKLRNTFRLIPSMPGKQMVLLCCLDQCFKTPRAQLRGHQIYLRGPERRKGIGLCKKNVSGGTVVLSKRDKRKKIQKASFERAYLSKLCLCPMSHSTSW